MKKNIIKILLVEDDPITAFSEQKSIQSFGYSAEVVNNGEDAVEFALSNDDINIILMDIDLGDGINGKEAAERILKSKNIPIIFLTSHSEEAYVESIKEITRYGYVLKNSGDFVLKSSIEMALQLFSANCIAKEREREIEKINHELISMNEEYQSANNALIETNSELIQKEKNLTRQKEETEKYLNIAAELIIKLNTDGTIELINDAGASLLGWEKQNLLGLNWFDTCLVPEERQTVKGIFIGIFDGSVELSKTFENQILCKDNSRKNILWHNTVLKNEDGQIEGVLSSGEDISLRKKYEIELKIKNQELTAANEEMTQANEEFEAANEDLINTNEQLIATEKLLRESEQKYKTAFKTSPDSVNINSMEGVYIDINQGFTDLTGFTEEDVIGKPSTELNIWAIPEDREKLTIAMRKDGYIHNLRSVFRCKDGSLIPGLMSASIIHIENIPYILSMTRDISEIEKYQKTIENLVEEKEALLHEVHHRIKNNINTIMSLLRLQSKIAPDKESSEFLLTASNRLQSMMTLYEKLYRSDNFKEINIKEFLETLIEEISTNISTGKQITITKDIEIIELDISTTSSIGIIINELMTNAVKHGFKDIYKGNISISLSKSGNQYILEVQNDGNYLKNTRIDEIKGFGLTLISMMSKQLKGSFTADNNGGTTFRIEFPIE